MYIKGYMVYLHSAKFLQHLRISVSPYHLVYGWVMFSDRLSNGVVVKIIQQATPSLLTGIKTLFNHSCVTLTPYIKGLPGTLLAGTCMSARQLTRERYKVARKW